MVIGFKKHELKLLSVSKDAQITWCFLSWFSLYARTEVLNIPHQYDLDELSHTDCY